MSTVVLKVGGASAPGAADAVARLEAAGHDVCVVHGAGPQISAEMARRGIAVEFVEGRRVTTADGIAVVRESLARVNAAIVAAVGPRAVGLIGDEIGLPATRIPLLGLVGDAVPSAPDAIVEALDAKLVPVVAPLATGPLNVNADDMAAAIAIGIGAERVCFLSDVPGLLLEGAVVSEIAADEAEGLLAGGGLEGGILPKLRAAVHAARFGVRAEIGETAVTA